MATATSEPLPAPTLPATPPSAYPMEWTIVDLQERLGGIPPERIHLYPWPGLATEKDVIEIRARTGRLCELIDGVLVAKPMNFYDSALAAVIGTRVLNYLKGRELGIVGASNGTLRIGTRIRLPDVSFIRWDRFPEGNAAAPAVCPDLAVEVLSEGNTEREMYEKLTEYFAGGTRLAWLIDPATRTARVYEAPDQFERIDEQGVLTGGDVLPGFELKLKDLFAELDRPV